MKSKPEVPLFSMEGLAQLEEHLEAHVKPWPKRRVQRVRRFRRSQVYKETMRYLYEGPE